MELSIELNLFFPNICNYTPIVELLGILLRRAGLVTHLQIKSSRIYLFIFYHQNRYGLRKGLGHGPGRRFFQEKHEVEYTTEAPLPPESDFGAILSLNKSAVLLYWVFMDGSLIQSSVWNDKLEIQLDHLPMRNFNDYIGIIACSPQLAAFIFRGSAPNGPYLSQGTVGVHLLV